MRKHTLWAGPEDGLDVQIDKDTFQYFIKGPPKLTPNNVISASAGPDAEIWIGRYQWNDLTSRFEWMGYE